MLDSILIIIRKLIIRFVSSLLTLFLMTGCGEEVPVACTPEAEECTAEQEGGFETGTVAGIAAGGAVAVALLGGALGGEEEAGGSGGASKVASGFAGAGIGASRW